MSLKEKKEQEKYIKAQLRQKDSERKEEIINLMINYPEIWNKSSPDFRDRQLQGVKWEELAKSMKMSIKDVKNMWKYLKDQFRTNFHAVSKKKSGLEYVEEEDIKLVKWPYFKQLMFLKDTVSRRETTCNLNLNDEDNGETADQILSAMASGSMPDEIIDNSVDQVEDDIPSPDDFISRESPLPQQILPEANIATASSASVTRDSTSNSGTASSASVTRASTSNSGTASSASVTRASTSNSASKKRKQVDHHKDRGDETRQEIREEISKIDHLIAASISHDCQQNTETRSQRFCKYLADLLSQVPEDSQLDCEMELMGVVRGYLRNKN